MGFGWKELEKTLVEGDTPKMNAMGTEQQWADALKAEQKKLVDVIENLRCLLRYDVISGEYNRSGYGEQSPEGDWVKWEDISEIINQVQRINM